MSRVGAGVVPAAVFQPSLEGVRIEPSLPKLELRDRPGESTRLKRDYSGAPSDSVPYAATARTIR